MSDAAAILALYDHARVNGLPVVLATVVGTRGSTYRKAGARMMLCGDGSRVGVVSGGCLEADVARRGWFLQSPGSAEVVRYDTGTGDDATYEFGLGCRGAVDVYVERLDASTDPPIIAALRASVFDRRSTTLAIDSIDKRYVETIDPPVQLVVFGSGVDAAPVVAIARAVGWRTVVVDGRLKPMARVEADAIVASPPGEWQREVVLDARTAAVLMTHRMADDAGYLRDVVESPVAYIGCLGPRSRTEALYDELAIAGVVVPETRRALIHSPIGLDLGAERPQEIALAIVAEVQAALAGAQGVKLSSLDGAIHRMRLVASASQGVERVRARG